MTGHKIITKKQILFLKLFAEEKNLAKIFYLSGGTTLTEFYIPYRYSDDLDFFSEQEVLLEAISVFLSKIKRKLGFKNYEFNTSFNRNLFFLNFNNETLKIEFTYFPFPQIESPILKDGVLVDSLIDIAVNKLFTIYQKPRSRDFMDLFMICSKYNLKMIDLVKNARIKFDTVIDPIKLGSQFLLCQELKDYPQLKIKLSDKAWQDFFLREASQIGKTIFK